MTPQEIERRIAALEFREDHQDRQLISIRREMQQQHEWLDTVNSHWIKRVWWWMKGYRYHRLGRWYGKDRPW